MANENNIGGKVGLDTTNFKAGITDLNRQIRVIETGFRASAAGLGEWGKTAEGLQARMKSLGEITELQKKKIAGLTEQYKKIAAEKGENSKEAQNLQVRINRETESLNKNENKLKETAEALDNFGKETDEASEKTGKFDGALGKLGSGLKKVGGAVGKAAVAGVAAVGTAAAGAAAGAFKLARDAGKAADDLNTLSNQTGISTEQLQEWDYAMRFIDVDMGTMTGSMAKLVKNVDQAQKGIKDQSEAFELLGVSIKDENGNLRDSQTIFMETIDALGEMENETQRDAMAMRLFGRSARELNPLIKAGSEELKKYSDEAHKMGAVMSDEALQSAQKFDDMMQGLDASMKGLKMSAGVAVMPMVTNVIKSVTGIVPAITNAVKTGDWEGAGQAITDAVSGLIGKLTDALPGLAVMASTIIGGLINTLVGMVPQVIPPLIDATIMLLDTVVEILVKNGPMLITAGINAIMTLIDGIVEALPSIFDAAVNIIMALVGSITDNLPRLIDASIKIIFALVDGIINLLPELIKAAIEMVVALARGLIDALPELIKKVPEIVKTIVNVIVDSLPLLVDAAIEIIMALVVAIIENLPLLISASIEIIGAMAGGLIRNVGTLVAAVPKLFKALLDAFMNLKWGDIGKNIITGISGGIKNAVGGLVDSAKDAAQRALNGVKNFLGIHSPSAVMRDQVGKMIGAGMSEGIADSYNQINSAMKGLSSTLIDNSPILPKTQNTNRNIPTVGTKESSEFVIHNYTILEGKQIQKSTSRLQAQKNRGKSRSLGEVAIV